MVHLSDFSPSNSYCKISASIIHAAALAVAA